MDVVGGEIRERREESRAAAGAPKEKSNNLLRLLTKEKMLQNGDCGLSAIS
jgi:hypothetical protein